MLPRHSYAVQVRGQNREVHDMQTSSLECRVYSVVVKGLLTIDDHASICFVAQHALSHLYGSWSYRKNYALIKGSQLTEDSDYIQPCILCVTDVEIVI